MNSSSDDDDEDKCVLFQPVESSILLLTGVYSHAVVTIIIIIIIKFYALALSIPPLLAHALVTVCFRLIAGCHHSAIKEMVKREKKTQTH